MIHEGKKLPKGSISLWQLFHLKKRFKSGSAARSNFSFQTGVFSMKYFSFMVG